MNKIIGSAFLGTGFALALKKTVKNYRVKKSFGAYKHVVILGLDGVGGFFKKANVPNFDRIFKDGAVIFDAGSEIITVSAENWGAILCGVSYDTHSFENEDLETTPRSSDSANNTVFKFIRDKYPCGRLASFNNWDAINTGLIENDLDVYKDKGSDDEVTEKIIDYLNEGNEPVLLFAHFDGADHIAHTYGGQTKEYYDTLTHLDECVGKIYNTLITKPMWKDTLFILVSDHGEEYMGGHGGQTDDESETMIAMLGKTVKKHGKFDKKTRNRDVASIVLHALGIEKPSHMTSRLPKNIWC